jgi:hypothetical protein
MPNTEMTLRLTVATETLAHNRNTLARVRTAYESGRCDASYLRAAMACVVGTLQAVEQLQQEYTQTTTRRAQ